MITPSMDERRNNPIEYPCLTENFNEKRLGRCICITCAPGRAGGTPSDEDSPAWAAKVARREAVEQGGPQPDFGTEPVLQSPTNNITTTFTHEARSGYTFEGMTTATRDVMRVSTKHSGAPGSSKDDVVDLNTPKK